MATATPLHHMEAEFFKTLAHPTRIRVLEVLSEGERSVSELLAALDLESSNLSQQLSVLRRAGLASARREGAVVFYSLTDPQVADVLARARLVLAGVLTEQADLLSGLRAEVEDPR